MKKIRFLPVLIAFLISCSPAQKKSSEISDKILFQPEDKKIMEMVFELFADKQDSPAAELVVKVGAFFKETPYVAHTLETDTEQLVINLREMDCTTFAENCLAFSKTIQSGKLTFKQFASELQKVRYRNGIIDGYPTRLHYFSDWINNNIEKMLVRDVGKEIGLARYGKEVDFMSKHPESYKQLSANPELIPIIAEQESVISMREMYYVPEDRIVEVEDQLSEGDIVGITTNVEGLDISHVGILVRKAGRIHLMHASSLSMKVVVSENTLEEYLLNSKSATGVMVARPL